MKTHLCILWFHLQEEYCWGGEGWKFSWFCCLGCFLVFEKSIISFVGSSLGDFIVCLPFSPSKDAFPRGLWQDGDIPHPCCKTAPGGFSALVFCPLQAALSQGWLWHPAAPGICLSSCVMLYQVALEIFLLLRVQDFGKSLTLSRVSGKSGNLTEGFCESLNIFDTLSILGEQSNRPLQGSPSWNRDAHG